MSLPATQALTEAASAGTTTTIELTHTRTSKESWERSDAHCPACGAKGCVCCMLGLPLAFDATPHACLSCGAQFALSMARADRMRDGDIERLKRLRESFPVDVGDSPPAVALTVEQLLAEILAELRKQNEMLRAVASGQLSFTTAPA